MTPEEIAENEQRMAEQQRKASLAPIFDRFFESNMALLDSNLKLNTSVTKLVESNIQLSNTVSRLVYPTVLVCICFFIVGGCNLIGR